MVNDKKNKPIERHPALRPLSRDHHHALLLVWKIRKGLANKTATDRIDKYSTWFFHQYIVPHLEIEEQHVYTLPDIEYELIKRAQNEHLQLRKLFTLPDKSADDLHQLAALLDAHIRFEERVLFNIIQQQTPMTIMESLLPETLDETFIENEADPFWI